MAHDFHYENNELYCEDVRVADIAKAVDTPAYIYSHHTVIDHYRKIQAAFAPVSPLICFAVKANDNLSILKTLLNEGSGLDIVSGGELLKAIGLKADPQKIVFASVGKTEEEIALAIKTGILLFNVESVPELEEINRVAGRLRTTVQVALRINPDVEAATHDSITTGTIKKKFGIDLRSARNTFKQRRKFPNLHMRGIHVHIGSQIVTSKPFVKAIKKVTGFIDELRREGVHIEYMDIGGGMGIIYKDENPQTAQQYADAILPYLMKMNLKIIMEPGRFIVGNAGILVTKVLYLKNNGYKNFIIVDGGMNDLIRPALYHAYHEIVPVQKTNAGKIKADVVGPVCESADFFAKDRLLPKMKGGELLAVMGAGAYGFTIASNYNARPRPPEVIVKGNRYSIVRERQNFEDLIRGEKIPAFLK